MIKQAAGDNSVAYCEKDNSKEDAAHSFLKKGAAPEI
jgi:hypothetical protein